MTTNDMLPPDHAAREAALDPQASVIVQAPAGSGKTGLLTQRFLRLLACVEQPEEIVAITFTRKAAAEMRERILGAMERAARGESGDNANERRLLGFAQEALAADHRQGWGLLANPARLRITTIDSFNAMLTRQMPLASGMGQQAAVAEDAERLCREAVMRLLENLDRRGDVSTALRRLLAHLDNRVDELIELLAGMLAKRDLWMRHLEIGGLDREVLEAVLRGEVDKVLRSLHAALPVSVREEIIDIARQCAKYLSDLERRGDNNECIFRLAALEEFPRPAGERLDDWRALADFLLTDKGNPRKRLDINMGFPPADKKLPPAEKQAREQHKQRMSALLAALEDSIDAVMLLGRLELLPPARYDDAQWEVLSALNALMPHAVLALQGVFRDRGEVDFAELAIRARQALGSDDAPTDLALKLDHRIRHLLVDEFQDTSHGQIDLLLRLTRGWDEGDGRTLFVVGDPMQSIYQFREAEVGHFLAVRDNGLGALSLRALRLSANFRSQAGVVAWVNEAFTRIFPRQDDIASGAIAFEPSVAVKPALPEAAVTVHAFDQNAFDAEAERVVALVREAVARDNETTAILVRAKAHLARILPRLRAAGIPFQAIELESLQRVPAIGDLLALTRVIVNPADSTALYAVLRAPWCGLRLAELALLADQERLPFELLDSPAVLQGLDENARARLARVVAALREADERRGRRPLRERVESAWLMLDAPATLRGAEELADAELYFELLQQLEEGGDLADINDLEKALERLHAAPDPEAGSTVQIMTLHKAKGLQFDNVIIPALDQVNSRRDRLLFQWLERPRADGGEQVLLGPLKSREDEQGGAIYRFIEKLKEEKESLERARLLYVGITRAERRVHLLGKARWSKKKDGITLAPPTKGSLLELLWVLPEVREAFEALPVPADLAADVDETATTMPLRRLPLDWQRPTLPPAPNVQLRASGIASGSEVVFDWAGDRMRHVGTLVHRYLERMAIEGIDSWNMARLEALPLALQLAELGVPENECTEAAREVLLALGNVLASERARWLLARHEDARNEWMLSGVDHGELVNVSMDRSFVEDGVRWIVDYKTSAHEGGGLEDFLDTQQQRYRAQLERYARLVHALEGRPVRVGLYFPLQDAWRSWTPVLDRAGKEMDACLEN